MNIIKTDMVLIQLFHDDTDDSSLEPNRVCGKYLRNICDKRLQLASVLCIFIIEALRKVSVQDWVKIVISTSTELSPVT